MRIIGGAWRGRVLQAPEGEGTRPTADRVRQALFDRLLHASWAGRGVLEGARVLDAFAGTGAFGLEALSRGAGSAVFMETDAAALRALAANIAACGAGGRCRTVRADVLRPPMGEPCGLVFLDPPYGRALLPPALAALATAGWLTPGALCVAEVGRDEALPPVPVVAEWSHGAARMAAWRAPQAPPPT